MNVYFIDPTYLKDEAWYPLLTYLKVKAVYSFIPKEDLPKSLYTIIKPYLKAAYANQNIVKYANHGVFWLRAHFEKHIRLLTEDYENKEDITTEIRKKYCSGSAYNNIINLDSENCLFLMRLHSTFDDQGFILPPRHDVEELQDENLPTHIRKYCLNILHKAYNHRQYQFQSAFIVFDEFLRKAYKATTNRQKWEEYILTLENGKRVNFMYFVNRAVKEISPQEFPIVEVNGKKKFTPLRTSKGDCIYRKLLEDAEEAEEAYKDAEESRWGAGEWQREVNEMNREFWRECGDASSNCDSWSGWD